MNMTWGKLKKLSNKEKCLHMWDYLRKTGKGKEDYFQELGFDLYSNKHHREIVKVFHHNWCGACMECEEDCGKCPVTWVDWQSSEDMCWCEMDNSPYADWAFNTKTKSENKKYADAVYNTIITTWDDTI